MSSRVWMKSASRRVRREGGNSHRIDERQECVCDGLPGHCTVRLPAGSGDGVFPSDRECPDNLLSPCKVLRSDSPEIVNRGLDAVPRHIVPPSMPPLPENHWPRKKKGKRKKRSMCQEMPNGNARPRLCRLKRAYASGRRHAFTLALRFRTTCST